MHAVEIEAETIVDDLHAVGNQIGGLYFKDYSCINRAYLRMGFVMLTNSQIMCFSKANRIPL